ncbi:hypothetical protein GC175_27625 [bacterium]|nr:hypothetical protein [bacterium]
MNLLSNLAPNPIIVKELRSRMRGGRAFAILTGMLLLLGGALYGLYRIMVANMFYTSMLSASIGQALFSGLALLLLAIICFVTPAVTASAVSSEREKLTYDMLLTTPLHPASILWGKLIAALSYVFLLIFAAVPLASLVFIFGGVALTEMFKALIVLVTIAVMLGVVGIFFSVWLGRTARATVMSYLFVLILVVGPLAVYIATGIIQQSLPPSWLLIPNPLSALFSAMTPSLSNSNGNFLGGLGMALSGELNRLNGMSTVIVRPLYHYSLVFYAALTLLLYGLSVQQIQPIRRWRLRASGVTTALLVVALVGGGTIFAFQTTSDQYQGSIFSPLPTPTPFDGMAMPAPMAVRAVEVRAVADPTPTPGTPTPMLVDGYPPAEAVAIYSAAVNQLLAELDLPAMPTLLIATTTDDVVGFATTAVQPKQPIPDAFQVELSSFLIDEVPTVAWTDEVPAEMAADELFIVFGSLRAPDEDTVLVSISATLPTGASAGRAYVLDRLGDEDGGWQVTETRASWGE